jgi:hypothetical protein
MASAVGVSFLRVKILVMENVIQIPESLAHELDLLAESEHKPRADYAVDVLWREVKRNKQRQALWQSSGAWKLADHPELAEGGAAYIERMRTEPDERFEDAIRRNQNP